MADQIDTDDSPPKRMKLEEKSSEENTVTDNKTSIMDLPDEAKIAIFKHLPKSDLFKNVALVCKEFYRVSQDSRLVTELRFENGELIDLENELQTLREHRLQNLQNASIAFGYDNHADFMRKINECYAKANKIGGPTITLHGIDSEDQIDPFIENMKLTMNDKEKSEIDLVRRATVSFLKFII